MGRWCFEASNGFCFPVDALQVSFMREPQATGILCCGSRTLQVFDMNSYFSTSAIYERNECRTNQDVRANGKKSPELERVCI